MPKTPEQILADAELAKEPEAPLNPDTLEGLLAMGLHSQAYSEHCTILRVPGGWIYSDQVFVPEPVEHLYVVAPEINRGTFEFRTEDFLNALQQRET